MNLNDKTYTYLANCDDVQFHNWWIRWLDENNNE